jgi:putative colanic acid biosynthesis acetyltransferase WcaF
MVYENRLSWSNRIGRVLWGIVWVILYRPSPTPVFAWRRMLLRLFGAQIGKGAHPYPSSKIWAPWNLSMGAHSCLAHNVDCYCVAPVSLGAFVTVSQYAFLCAATHDFRDAAFPLQTKPISVGAKAWVAAGAFIGPGVTVGEGAVVGARAVVVRNVPPYVIVAGNPARAIGVRTISSTDSGVPEAGHCGVAG